MEPNAPTEADDELARLAAEAAWAVEDAKEARRSLARLMSRHTHVEAALKTSWKEQKRLQALLGEMSRSETATSGEDVGTGALEKTAEESVRFRHDVPEDASAERTTEDAARPGSSIEILRDDLGAGAAPTDAELRQSLADAAQVRTRWPMWALHSRPVGSCATEKWRPCGSSMRPS